MRPIRRFLRAARSASSLSRWARVLSVLVLAFGMGGLLDPGLGARIVRADSGIPRSESPEGAALYFISPTDGATVSSPVTVRFGLTEMGVAPAGVEKSHTGHHHLIVDAGLPPVDLPIPKNDHYRHFGAGQTEVELTLEPGPHTLQLLLGDHNHVPHDPPVVSERITIEVE